MSWLGLGLGEFGSQLGEGHEIAEQWRQRREQLALEQARAKLEESLIPLRMIEAKAAEERLRQMTMPQAQLYDVPGVGLGYTMTEAGKPPGPFQVLAKTGRQYKSVHIGEDPVTHKGKLYGITEEGTVEEVPSPEGVNFPIPGAPRIQKTPTYDPAGDYRYAWTDPASGQISSWGPLVPDNERQISYVDDMGNTRQFTIPSHLPGKMGIYAPMTPEAMQGWQAIEQQRLQRGGRRIPPPLTPPAPGVSQGPPPGAAAGAGPGAAAVAPPAPTLEGAIDFKPPKAAARQPITQKPPTPQAQVPGPPGRVAGIVQPAMGLPQWDLANRNAPSASSLITSAPALPNGQRYPDEQVGATPDWAGSSSKEFEWEGMKIPGVPPGPRIIHPGRISAESQKIIGTIESAARTIDQLRPIMVAEDWQHRTDLSTRISDAAKARLNSLLYGLGIGPITSNPQKLAEETAVLQLGYLLQVMMTTPYMRGMRNFQYIEQIQKHLPNPGHDAKWFFYQKLAELVPILRQMRQDNLVPFLPWRGEPKPLTEWGMPQGQAPLTQPTYGLNPPDLGEEPEQP